MKLWMDIFWLYKGSIWERWFHRPNNGTDRGLGDRGAGGFTFMDGKVQVRNFIKLISWAIQLFFADMITTPNSENFYLGRLSFCLFL